MRRIIFVLLLLVMTGTAWGDAQTVGKLPKINGGEIDSESVPVEETIAALGTGIIGNSTGTYKKSDGDTWVSVSNGSNLTSDGMLTVVANDLETDVAATFRFETAISLLEAAKASVETVKTTYLDILRVSMMKWLDTRLTEGLANFSPTTGDKPYPYTAYKGFLTTFKGLFSEYETLTMANIAAVLEDAAGVLKGTSEKIAFTDADTAYSGLYEAIQAALEETLEALAEEDSDLEDITLPDASALQAADNGHEIIAVIVAALEKQVAAMEEFNDFAALADYTDVETARNKMAELLYDAVFGDSDLNGIAMGYTVIEEEDREISGGTVPSLENNFSSYPAAEGFGSGLQAALAALQLDAAYAWEQAAQQEDADAVIDRLKSSMLRTFLGMEMDLLSSYGSDDDTKPLSENPDAAVEVIVTYRPGEKQVDPPEQGDPPKQDDKPGNENSNSGSSTEREAVGTDTENNAEVPSEDTSKPTEEAEQNVTPEEAAAIDQAQKAVEALGIPVSVEEILAYARNIMAISEDAKAETDKNSPTYGEVKETTTPAASPLPLSENPTDAINGLNDLPVQPKVVEPTAIKLNEAQSKAFAEALTDLDEKASLGIPADFTTDALVSAAGQLVIASADKTLAAQGAAVVALFDELKDLLASVDTARGAGETSNGVLIAAMLSDILAKTGGYYTLNVNLRHLAPRRYLRFWYSVDDFMDAASEANLGLTAGHKDAFFLDQNGVPTAVVSGDASKMMVVAYFDADTPCSPFITVDATSAEAVSRNRIVTEISGEDTSANNIPRHSRSGCDVGFGILALLLPLGGLLRKR